MEIMHRISINSKKDAELMSAVLELGIDHKALELPGGTSKLITFVITESDPRWAIISEIIAIKGAVDIAETIFSDDEIREAEWLRLKSTFEQGYPQPKSHWPLKQLSYEIICPNCAIHEQTHPMRLAKEPNLGKKSFMSTIWTTEAFCTTQVIFGLEAIKAQGYQVWDVLMHKTSQPLERVRQLYVSSIASPGVIISDDLERRNCPVCGVTKYYPHVKGAMSIRREALLSDTDFMLTHEWFGHGYLAWREILVSNRVARLILDRGWQGARLKVVEVI